MIRSLYYRLLDRRYPEAPFDPADAVTEAPEPDVGDAESRRLDGHGEPVETQPEP